MEQSGSWSARHPAATVIFPGGYDETTKAFACCLSAAASCVIPSLSLAADNCSGTYVNVGQSAETTELASGNTLVLFKATTINITDDHDSPLNLSVGDCVGTSLTASGKTNASGRCSRKDKDGDVYSYEWAMPADADKGTWTFVGGTGKYANAMWSGWWRQTMAEGKAVGGIWGGNCR
jgi:hypothetical protein